MIVPIPASRTTVGRGVAEAESDARVVGQSQPMAGSSMVWSVVRRRSAQAFRPRSSAARITTAMTAVTRRAAGARSTPLTPQSLRS